MYKFIVNPVAGNGKTIIAMQYINNFLKSNNIPYDVVYSTFEKGITQLAKEVVLNEKDTVVFVGGDGTFNEGINGLKNLTSVKIGFIPSGTGNDFAYSLGLSENYEDSLNKLLNGKVHKIDYIQGSSRISINTASTGLDVDVMQKYNKAKRKTKATYKKSLLKTLLAFKFKKFQIVADGKEFAGQYMLAAACNGKHFGAGMNVSPMSDVTDGLINLILIKRVCRVKVPFILINFLKGKHLNKNWAIHLKCKKVEIKNSDGTPVITNYDGELEQNGGFKVKVVAGGLNVVI